MITEGEKVYNLIGDLLGTVDRSMASEREYGCDAQIFVTLYCGHTERFWDTRHPNEEYIQRTINLKNSFNKNPFGI